MNPTPARILVTNDDGHASDGLAALEAIARELTDDVWTVAPESEQSGVAHSLSMHDPIRMRQLDDKRYAVDGTPTDCVLMALLQIMPDAPTLILSGINRGRNVAEDVTYSGTIAAAMEGTLLEVPSIALSMDYRAPSEFLWETPKTFAPDIIRRLAELEWPHGNLMNINFPGIAKDAVKGVKLCPQGRRKIGEKLEKRTDPRGRDYYWIGNTSDEPFEHLPGADYLQLKEGYITVTPIQMDLTNYRMLEALREQFEHSAPKKESA